MKQSRINFLKRVESVQNEFSKHDDGTRTTQAIYEFYIKPNFHISAATLRSHLRIKVRKELYTVETHTEQK